MQELLSDLSTFPIADFQNSFSIETAGIVTGGDPSGTLLPGVDRTQRKVNFDLVGYDAIDPLNQSWNGKPVWIISHGWNSNANNFDNLAETVRAALGENGLVLTLDWSEAANTGGNFFTQDNNKASSWISSIADFAAQKLRDWGLTDGGSLNFIGHSLGSILSAEIASRFTKSNSMVALEPPSDANIVGFSGSDPSKYDTDFSTSGRQAPKRFNEVSNFSRAFVGSRSNAASVEYASTAQESILMDFGIRFDTGQEHGWVIETFSQLVATNPSQRKLANGLFSLNNIFDNANFRDNSYNGAFSFRREFEGIIRVNQPDSVVSFTARKNTSNSQDEFVYGTNLGDSLDGGLGDDDLFADAGNDVVMGGRGHDYLSGGEGADQFVFDINRSFVSAIGVDAIADFQPGIDKIVLDQTTFSTLTTTTGTTLNESEFSSVNDANLVSSSAARIVFNQATSELFFNANAEALGLGTGGLFARLTGLSALSASDFLVRA
jgi:pimeloyl-ACP methyl ester carboxylesterase